MKNQKQSNTNFRKVDMAEPWRQQCLQKKKELIADAYAEAAAKDAPFSVLYDLYEAKKRAERKYPTLKK